MKKLDEQIRSPNGLGGFVLTRKDDFPDYYIYEQYQTRIDKIVGYHVFEKKINTMFNCESYPGGEAFGVLAWQCITYEQALKIYERESTRVKEPINTSNGEHHECEDDEGDESGGDFE